MHGSRIGTHDVRSYETHERTKESGLGKNYKWIALSNTTLGSLMASIDSSILIISLPAIFNGLGVNPYAAGNIDLLASLAAYGIYYNIQYYYSHNRQIVRHVWKSEAV